MHGELEGAPCCPRDDWRQTGGAPPTRLRVLRTTYGSDLGTLSEGALRFSA